MIRIWQRYGSTTALVVIVFASIIMAGGYAAFKMSPIGEVSYSQTAALPQNQIATSTEYFATSTPVTPPPFVVTHVNTPEHLKAIYYTSWAAGSQKYRMQLFDILNNTDINAIVIDVKDYSGRISFNVEDPLLIEYGSAQNRIPDIKEFIGELHKRNIYVIARISSFQDSYLINVRPEWAVKTQAGEVWKDYMGVKWLDAAAKPVWEYLVAIGNEAYKVGFDELNFDYIRFPSDGNLRDISYTWSEGRSRREVMKSFFQFMHESYASTSIPISADLFGLVTTAQDDLGIGQVLEDALPYFDYIYPMVYPSHFGKGYLGYEKPARYPYEVVKHSMDKASIKALNASSSPQKIRPWLQAFDLGAIYTPAMVHTQMQATYDAGLNGWLLWNAASVYDKKALSYTATTTRRAESIDQPISELANVSSAVSTTTAQTYP